MINRITKTSSLEDDRWIACIELKRTARAMEKRGYPRNDRAAFGGRGGNEGETKR